MIKDKRVWIGLFFILLILFLRIILKKTGYDQCISLQYLTAQKNHLHGYIQGNYVSSVLLYIGLYATGIMTFLPVSALMTIAGGFLFGVFPGIVYAIIAASIGALGAFFFVRYSIGLYVQARYGQKLQWLNTMLARKGIWYLLLMRCMVVIPFSLVNILVGMTKISWHTFFWTTAVGIIPVSFVFAYTGYRLRMIECVSDIFSVELLLALVGVSAMALIPAIINLRARKRSVHAKH